MFCGVFCGNASGTRLTACNEAAPDAPEDKVLLSLSTSLNNDNWEDESRVNRDDNDKRSILSFAEGDTIRVDAWYMPQGGSSATDEPDVFRKQLMTYTNRYGITHQRNTGQIL